MKRVTLKSLSLVNFRGEKERTTVFNADVTTISGANGLGKSRHFDAFIWLMFGKDSQERKDYEIKTRVNGEELHKCECSVTGVLDVDGEEITLKRAFVEDWVKPRGQTESEYKGNHTECWWNDTPVKVSEYDKRVKDIVDASVFKMITNPAFFANMKWQLQREQLFLLAGTITDEEIAQRSPEFTALLDKISGKSLADFKAELSARKKRLKDELSQIQPRIDQTQKMMPANEDFQVIEAEIAKVDKEISEIDNAIADVTAAIRKQYEAEQAKQNRVNELKSECSKLVYDVKAAAQEAAFELRNKRSNLEQIVKELIAEKEHTEKNISSWSATIEQTNGKIEQLKAEQAKLREQWFAENEKEYNGETVCPNCGQELPEEMVERAREIFKQAQADKCKKITSTGKEIGGEIKQQEEFITSHKELIAEKKELIAKLDSQIESKQKEIAGMPAIVGEAKVYPESIPEWVAKQKQIAEIEATIATDNSVVDTKGLQEKKAAYNTKRGELAAKLANRDVIAKSEREIASLEARGKELAQQIADAEREEYTAQQFTKKKIEECESRINGLFKFVSFRLFDYTLEGNPVETCVPLVDGVPYGSANTASKVNAGLDIINALCRYYGICAPIFIDGRESVNHLIDTEGQIINLVVTTEKCLTVK